jgi:hypothetical protein
MKSEQTCEGCQGKGFLDKSDGYDYGEVVCPICVDEDNSKQSTLEQTLEEYIEKYSAGIIEPHIRTLHKMCFKDGAKWMEERRYSDEDVLNIIFKFTNDFDLKKNIEITSEEQRLWFEKYKKKS